MSFHTNQYFSHAPLGFGDVSLHHIPNYAAASVIATLIADSIGLGIVMTDVCSHLRYDWRLISSPGWRSPLQIICRSAYFICRYGTIINLLMVIIYINMPNINCTVFFEFLKWIWWFAISAVDVIFFARTAVLFDTSQWLVIPIVVLFFSYFSLGTYLVVHWGVAVRIPNSDFCAFRCFPDNVEPLRSVFIAYYAIATTTNTLVLVLTIWVLGRKVKGQSLITVLKYSFQRRPKKDQEKDEPASQRLVCTLLVQGFILYGLLELIKMTLVFTHYYTSNSTSYQLMIFGINVALGAIISGYLLRQASDVMRQTQGTVVVSMNTMMADFNDDSKSPRSRESTIDRRRRTFSHQRGESDVSLAARHHLTKLPKAEPRVRRMYEVKTSTNAEFIAAAPHDGTRFTGTQLTTMHSTSTLDASFADAAIEYGINPDHRLAFCR